jgi:hypothetical protein
MRVIRKKKKEKIITFVHLRENILKTNKKRVTSTKMIFLKHNTGRVTEKE